ncbi:MAG: hypothetical protein J6W60_01460 [Treponema sp.]|nr:hypothetical protein [Treponema sp.]
MILKVNGENVDITLDSEKTVGDFLKSFESEAAKNQATTTGIKLNGKEIPAEEIDGIMENELKDDTLIELDVVSKPTVIESFHKCAASFEEIDSKLAEISVLLQSGKDRDASDTINFLATAMSDFVHVARMSVLFPELYEQISIDGKNLQAFFEEFSPILKDFEQAMESKDSVTVGDLSEYEISPRLKNVIQALQSL